MPSVIILASEPLFVIMCTLRLVSELGDTQVQTRLIALAHRPDQSGQDLISFCASLEPRAHSSLRPTSWRSGEAPVVSLGPDPVAAASSRQGADCVMGPWSNWRSHFIEEGILGGSASM